MATLDEILAEMPEHDYFLDDVQFIIDENLRTVAVPSDGVVLGVTTDKNVNRVNFRMIRYYNGFDLSEFEGCIQYQNANGQPNYYNIEDLTVGDDDMTFTWLVDSDACAYAGTVRFTVTFTKFQNEFISNRFNTTTATAQVLEGISVDEKLDPTPQKDLLREVTKMLNAYEGLRREVDDLQDRYNNTAFIPLEITSFSNDVGIAEMGASVNSIKLTWGLNRSPKELFMNDIPVAATITGEYTISGPITTNANFVLKAIDTNNTVVQKSTSVAFCNRICYGTLASTSYSSSLVNSLQNAVLSPNQLSSFTVDADVGQYIYYCYPSRLRTIKTPVFSVSGFEGGFTLMKTVSYTNASGYTETYDIWRSNKSGLGLTTVNVS